MAGVWQGMLDLVAPRRCAACDLVLNPEDAGFCGGCEPLLEEGGEVGNAQGELLGWAAYEYAGPLAEAVRRFKYERRSELGADLGRRLARCAERYAGTVEEVVPVPLHARRLRARGFNQAALLASPVAARLGVPLRLARLRRVRDTEAQASLARQPRVRNVQGAFRATGRVSRRILLVDDVATSGASLAAARETLLEAGAAAVHGLVLACAPA